MTILEPLAKRLPCVGPRGNLTDDQNDDALRFSDLDTEYPTPFIGSQRELGLKRTWMTASDRYGPYGFTTTNDARSQPDWDKVSWANLQDDCAAANAKRFPNLPTTIYQPRFTLLANSTIDATPHWTTTVKPSRRTAIVVRSWEGVEYKTENMYMLRSLITEASLDTGAEYSVILLINIKDRKRNIHASTEDYRKALASLKLPPELVSIAVLWDENLLASWYPQVKEHGSMFQINQPLQLFALHYPEFDHYWQIELDQRFMGHAGEMLDAMADFARMEPRKQALERSTFPYSEELYDDYEELMVRVDEASKGKSRAWPALRISDVKPVGPVPPDKSQDDAFSWGVGEEAAFIATSFCADVRTSTWVFGGWLEGHLNKGHDTPRWFCPPAIFRVSKTVLLEAHRAQFETGLSLPSESTMPTWALWLGLKVSYPPLPVYMHPYSAERSNKRPGNENDETSRLEDEWRHHDKRPFFGHLPERSENGLSMANPQSFADRGLTYWWVSNWPRRIMDVWMRNEVDAADLPGFMRVHEGQVYAPNFMMHPVKT
ncbi:uncharacterized protein F5Z01DRAFT_625554 [Emericellopsis atlantica]|uniref:Uncharacterized protein n=1 Tax=Emericellopsis atlantica TaxID=2614577 RepID=A0A9P7ZIA7_9HYPO|nr:uncharacterized protein F5Z01DRAFT_625554 [Emericellopsis atlantica]KAG9252550.1 hypothetical protein F5Z01DRAFT_625554 [Emericellopsis atlantica]